MTHAQHDNNKSVNDNADEDSWAVLELDVYEISAKDKFHVEKLVINL